MSILTLLSTADASWREQRPFLGGILLIVAGLIVGYVPIQFTLEFIMMGGNLVAAIGMLFAVLIFLTGVFALLRPEQSTNLGIAGVAFSILSVVGALGGLLVGLLVGIIGSNLLISWEPPGRAGEEYPSATAPSGGEAGWQEKIGGAGLSAPTAGSSSSPSTGGGGQSFSWMDDHSARTTTPDTTQMDTTDSRSTSTGTGTGFGGEDEFTTGSDTGGTYQSSGRPQQDTGRPQQDTGRPQQDTGRTQQDTGRTQQDTGRTQQDTGRTQQGTGGPGSGPGGTSRSDEGSVDFSWQDDPDARSGSPQEDVGTGFQAERESTMDDEDDEDDDDPTNFSWSDD